jgi:hypothetical protein
MSEEKPKKKQKQLYQVTGINYITHAETLSGSQIYQIPNLINTATSFFNDRVEKHTGMLDIYPIFINLGNKTYLSITFKYNAKPLSRDEENEFHKLLGDLIKNRR